MTTSALHGIESTKALLRARGLDTTKEITEAREAASEILCAHYCLAIAVLGKDPYASDQLLFNFYTAETFRELQGLISGSTEAISFEKLAEETINLYLRGNPSLAEFARQTPQYVSEREVKGVEAKKSWGASCCLMAKTRILKRLGVSVGSLAAFPIGITVVTALGHGMRLFGRMRPVLVEPK